MYLIIFDDIDFQKRILYIYIIYLMAIFKNIAMTILVIEFYMEKNHLESIFASA